VKGEGGLRECERTWAASRIRAEDRSASPPMPSARLRPQMLPRWRRGPHGGRGCNRWSRSVASVPPAARERAPHGGRDEVLRLHVPQTWGIPRRLVAYGIARRSPFQGPRGFSSGWSAPQSRPPHLAQRLKHTAAPYERREGDKRLGRVGRSSRSFRGFFRTSPIRVTALRPERRKVAGPRARSPACVCGSTTEVFHSFSTARWG
jgi:hypothetical protein